MPVCPPRIPLRPKTAPAARWLASAARAAVLGLGLAGCKTAGNSDITGSIGAAGAPANPRSEADWRRSLEVWGARYKANPGDVEAAIAYARALRATDQRAQAVAVLEQASMRSPNSMQLSGAYGRALADAGQLPQALDALGRAHTPDNPDWRILNAQGAVLDQMGRHADAQRHYTAALKIVPGEPAVLSNLGLSYALMKDLKRAEKTLRIAAARPNAGPKVRQNLALAVGLQGRFAEAEKIAAADLPPDEAAANVAYLREMLEQQNALKKMGKRPKVPRPDAGT
jgi:Flp pilus assembly protein TadD